MDDVRIGVIGVGGMGAFHARTLAALAGVRVAAVADPSVENRTAVAADVGCDALDDPLALATRDDVDGVVVASPDETHAELTLAAIDRGTFVLCEKPLATSLDDARRIVEAERSTGRRLVQVGFMREYDPAHRQVVDALATAGAVHHLRAVHRNAHDEVRPVERIVRQSMVHDVHSIRFLTGAEFAEVHVVGSGGSGDRMRYVTALCRLDSGASALVEFDDTAFGYDVSVEVIADRADVLTGQPPRATVRADGTIDEQVGADWFARFTEAYRIQDEAWVASIRAGAATGPTARDGLVAEAVVAAMLRSFAEGRPVAVDPVD